MIFYCGKELNESRFEINHQGPDSCVEGEWKTRKMLQIGAVILSSDLKGFVGFVLEFFKQRR